MLLYLMRHGIAEERGGRVDDDQRKLTDEGRDKTRDAARGLKALGVKPSAMLASPLVRAVETAEIAAEAFGFSAKKIQQTEALAPSSPAELLLKELAALKVEEVMCFGHAPGLDDFIAHVFHSNLTFTSLKKAGAACIEITNFSPREAVLQWIATPKMLKQLAG
jgi:phosphohistidine phosphatase